LKARKVKKLDPAGPLAENAARIVRTRVGELLGLADIALDQAEVEAQHDLRIAAKRLRYVLELTGFCLGRPADTALRRARELQDVLGEMHDCDVMLPRVRDHVASLQDADADAVRGLAGPADDVDPRLAIEAPNRPDYHGLEILAVHLAARRRLMFDRFAAFWSRQEELGTWARLERAAEAQLERSRQTREAADRVSDTARPLMAKVLFVCRHNAGRSQMSQALFERAAGGGHEARSAGTTPVERVHPDVLEAMAEVGIDLSGRVPRKLSDEDAQWADVVVTMGCGDECPYIPGKRYIDWDLEDPKGQPVEKVRATRDDIEGRVAGLLAELS